MGERLGYFAVRLTGLAREGLHHIYFPLYEAIAAGLVAIPGVVIHFPHRKSNPAQDDDLSAVDVYRLDRLHVAHSDFVVACLELPSFGVGAELQLCAEYAVPVIPFFYLEAATPPSRLVLGMPPIAGAGEVIRYAQSPSGIESLTEGICKRVEGILGGSNSKRPQRMLAKRIADACERLGLAADELAHRCGVDVSSVAPIFEAGDRFREWLHADRIRRRLSISPEVVDEDRVLLPGAYVTQSILHELSISLTSAN